MIENEDIDVRDWVKELPLDHEEMEWAVVLLNTIGIKEKKTIAGSRIVNNFWREMRERAPYVIWTKNFLNQKANEEFDVGITTLKTWDKEGRLQYPLIPEK